MKNKLDYLPSHKQAELAQITEMIRQLAPAAELIILFGSYARNHWVEEKYDEEHYRYQSDFDILVLIESKSDALQDRLETVLEMTIRSSEAIKTPVSIIVHGIDFVNKRLTKAQYFFTDIKKEGVALYDSGKLQLKEARELLPAERKKLAEEDFSYWFNSADDFLEQYKFAIEGNKLAIGAFLLHQVTERLYSGILLVFTRYKPNSHDLAFLRKLVNSLDNRLLPILALDTLENRHLFKLLRKAYVDARYNPNYVITNHELLQLCDQVEELKKIGHVICQEKIDSYI